MEIAPLRTAQVSHWALFLFMLSVSTDKTTPDDAPVLTHKTDNILFHSKCEGGLGVPNFDGAYSILLRDYPIC